MAFTDGLSRDAVFAMRLFGRAPLFTATAVLTLALGVGVNAAIFSVVNAFIMRPLPVRDGDRLMVVATKRDSGPALRSVSVDDLQDYRAATSPDTFEDIAGYSVGFLGLAPDGRRPERVLVTWVTDNYFQMLDLRPAVGRLIVPGDRLSAVVVLGYSTWQRRFAASATVIGRSVVVSGRVCRVIGVAPRGFAGTFAFSESEIYLPLNWTAVDSPSSRDARGLHALGRLRPGVSVDRAQAVLDVVTARLRRDHPDTNAGIGAVVVPERLARPEEDQARSSGRAAATMLALVGLVLLVAILNLASLLLAHGAGRARELAIRTALGAGRWRILRQLIVESLLLSVLGGLAGIVLGGWAAGALTGVRLPGDLPVRFAFDVDGRVIGYAVLLVGVTGLTLGLGSGLRSSRIDADRVLRASAQGVGLPPDRARLRRVLVAGEIAICFVLLSVAGLFVRSLAFAARVDPGFEADRVLNVQMDVGQLGYDEPRGRAFFDEIERRVAVLPGVIDISFAFTVPMGYISVGDMLAAEGRSSRPGDRVFARKNMVGRGYFDTMGIPIVRGRPFGDGDTRASRPVAVVNERLAGILWPNQDAIGRRFSASDDGPFIEVVGVTPTGKYRSLFEDPLPYFYVPIAQDYVGLRVLHVRVSGQPLALQSAVEAVVHEREPDLPLYDAQSMREALGGGYGLFLVRVGAIGAALLALVALSLAVVGIFGVVSYLVAERTHEIGVRRALGATSVDILRLLMRESVVLVAFGVSIGLVLAVMSTRMLGAFLVGIRASDPLAFAAVAPIVAGVALAASAIPAWRATAVDPAVTLRAE